MASNPNDRKFMELAVEEMLKSRLEHTHKIDPLVGAVLVGPDGSELGHAHRGALRTGDHAEYTLIERLLVDRNLDGSTLYVTLEPCTVRQTPKKPCVERIIAARLGKVFIGMPDPNPDITSQGIIYLLANGIEVDFFDVDLVKQIRGANRGFIDYFQDAVEEVTGEGLGFEGPSGKEKEPVMAATVDDFALETIEKYLDSRHLTLKVPSQGLWDFMHKNGFLVEGKTGSYVPTVAGILLFGKTPEDFLTQSKVMLEARVGVKLITDEVKGPLLGFRDKIDTFFQKHMRLFTEIREFERVKVHEYPVEALREMVINAIVHRDYRGGTRVLIQMLGDRIVVKSPGMLLRPLTLDRIRAFNAPPYSRNPRIAVTFQHMKLMEERASGIQRMRDLLVKRGLRPPLFDIDAGYFVVTFLGQEHARATVRVAPDLLNKLEEPEREIVCLIMKKRRVTTRECASKFKVDVATARRHLGKLKTRKIIETRGSGSKIYYVLKGG